MKRLWRALAFLATAGAALFLSTAALAVAGGSSPEPAQWRATLGRATWSGKLRALYPGALNDDERFAVAITNTGHTPERLSSVTASIATTAAAGCRADWFTVAVAHGRPLPARVGPRDAYTGTVVLAMRDSGTNQDACRGASPTLTVTAR